MYRERAWRHETYGSGTQVVTRGELSLPWLYVYGGKTDALRSQFCGELCAFMNGGDRPEWFDILIRVGDRQCAGIMGILIDACGPMYLPENDNGALNWQTDDTEVGRDSRKQLIDLICPYEESNG